MHNTLLKNDLFHFTFSKPMKSSIMTSTDMVIKIDFDMINDVIP